MDGKKKCNHTENREAGFLGIIFGHGNHAPVNVLGLVVVMLVAAGVAAMFSGSASLWLEKYLSHVVPLISLVVLCLAKGISSRTKSSKSEKLD